MKKRLILISMLAGALWSCEKTEHLEDKYFVKSFGANANSSMSFISETETGGYLLGGRIGVPSFVGNAFNNVGAQKFIEASGPALILADDQANSITQRIYPVEDMDLADPIYVDELSGTGRILQIFPKADGGYLALGEFRNLGIGIGNTYIEPSNSNIASFLLHLNAAMELTEFQPLSAPPGQAWDGLHHTGGVLKKHPNGGFILMLGINFEVSANRFRGFQLIELDSEGKNPVKYEYYGGFHRHATDFDFLPNGDILVLGQTNTDAVHLFLIEGGSMGLRSINYVIEDGVGTDWNKNPMFVLPHDDGAVDVVMAYPNEKSLIVRFDPDLNTIDTIDIEPDLIEQFPRSACLAPNGDLLILNDDLTGGTSERSFLYRFGKDGKRKFRVAFEGPGQYVTNASDGSILVLTDLPFNGVSVKKSTLYKLSPDGTF